MCLQIYMQAMLLWLVFFTIPFAISGRSYLLYEYTEITITFLQLLGWSSLLLASVSCTTADSDGNTETHGLDGQFVQPHSQHDAPYAADYSENLHWPPRMKDEKRTAKPVIAVNNNLQRIEKIHEGGDKVDGDWLEKQGSLFPALRKAPLVVQAVALLQLCVAFAALGGQYSDAVFVSLHQFFEKQSFLCIFFLFLFYCLQWPSSKGRKFCFRVLKTAMAGTRWSSTLTPSKTPPRQSEGDAHDASRCLCRQW